MYQYAQPPSLAKSNTNVIYRKDTWRKEGAEKSEVRDEDVWGRQTWVPGRPPTAQSPSAPPPLVSHPGGCVTRPAHSLLVSFRVRAQGAELCPQTCLTAPPKCC